jgi:O-antigen/teichoic acid export membrane protein
VVTLRAPAPSIRPLSITIAVIISVVIIIGNFASPILPNGSGDEKVPTSVIVIGFVLAVIGIAAAVGLWMLRKRGAILTIVLSAINLLLAAPGIPFGPGTAVKLLSLVFTLLCAATIVLVLRPESRRAWQPARNRTGSSV